jgi:2-(1,2-epoxy-1,2-dihydrophenyl)acetyl-CoA isomerase
MSDPILLDRSGAVATLTLDRPAALNTLDFAMMDMLVAHTSTIAADDSLRVVVLRGSGRHFMAGGDVAAFAQRLEAAPAARRALFQRAIEGLHAAIENLHRMPHPVIARVQGAAAGFGLSLVCACDLAIAADDAYFTSAYRHLGLTPDGGGTWALPRIVGLRKAMEIVLLSERFDAQEALRIGIVNKVVPAPELDATINAIVESLAHGPVDALRNAKRLLRESPGRSLSEQLQAEAVSFAQCTATPDFVEGVRAFMAKRNPRFSD